MKNLQQLLSIALVTLAAAPVHALGSTAEIQRACETTNTRTNSMKPQFYLTPGYGPRLREMLHYSQAVRIGDRVETSGQGGWNDDLEIPTSLEEEITQAFRNVEKTLATAGASWEHVVHVNSYHVGGFPPEVNQTMTKLYRKYMPHHAPIWTQTGVDALGLPTMRFEIRVTAIVCQAKD